MIKNTRALKNYFLFNCVLCLLFFISCSLRQSVSLESLETIVIKAINNKSCPGALVCVGSTQEIVYSKAFGNKQVEPEVIPMTLDTIFDCASLTKVFTAVGVMLLVQEGKINLTDRVTKYIPEFGVHKKEFITIEHLLRHRAGLCPDNALDDYKEGKEKALAHICDLSLEYEPGTGFVYSDVGYILLGFIIEKVTGVTLDTFCDTRIFKPLGMSETSFCPDPKLHVRCAPCDKRDGVFIKGAVHDPRAYYLNGVAGHAGIFSTIRDLVKFCRVFLNNGRVNNSTFLKPEYITLMTSMCPEIPKDQQRGLGFDINTRFSSARGDIFPVGSYGHVGFTGTSLWIDQSSGYFLIILTNRLHPDGKGDVKELRRALATQVGRVLYKRLREF
jgi:CubicO group peptidase (beta-lactamase class C family)